MCHRNLLFFKNCRIHGTRLGYTIIPKALKRNGMNMNEMWVRNRTTKTNGVSYIIQKGGAAVFSEEGQKQIHENIQIYKKNAKVFDAGLGSAWNLVLWREKCPLYLDEMSERNEKLGVFDYLLQEIQVVGTPGEGFGACGEGYFRFSTFSSPEDTKEAAKRIVKLLS